MGFLSKIRNNMRKKVSRMPSRGRRSALTGLRIPNRRTPLEDMITSGRLPQPNIGDMRFRGEMPQELGNFRRSFLTGLRIPKRRTPLEDMIAGGRLPQPIPRAERMPDQETLDKFRQMASRPNPFVRDMITDDGRMRAMPIRNEDGTIMSSRLQMPQPIPKAEIDISALERLPMGDMPMTQDLPEVAPIGMMPQMRMSGMQDMEPRMMMQAGEDVSLERELFSLQSQLKNLEEQLRLDRSYNDDQAVIDTSAQMAAIQRRIQEILQESGRTMSDLDRAIIGRKTMSDMDKGRTTSDLDMSRPQLAGGGEPFPDLSGDGQITRKDILMGQGVKFKAEGGEMMTQENEIDAMLGGMDSEEAGAMEDLEQMAPEMEMIDQLVMMVVQMIQQGASEEEVIMFLREQGLDDEDIGTVLQLVAEMAEAEAMPQDGIGAELEQLA